MVLRRHLDWIELGDATLIFDKQASAHFASNAAFLFGLNSPWGAKTAQFIAMAEPIFLRIVQPSAFLHGKGSAALVVTMSHLDIELTQSDVGANGTFNQS